MTREEAIYRLKNTAWLGTNKDREETEQAVDMAIEALKAEPNKAIPPSLADVYKWERDIALSQLEEYGIGFAEKKRDDLVWVVRCKDCRHRDLFSCPLADNDFQKDDDYCSWGERGEE